MKRSCLAVLGAVGLTTLTAAPLTHAAPPDAETTAVLLEALYGAIDDNPQDAITMYRLGRFLIEYVGDSEEGQGWIDQALAIDPSLSPDPGFGTWEAGGNQGTVCGQPGGPDVIVGVLPDISNPPVVGVIKPYAVGTTSCNIGDQTLIWIAGNNQHPVIGQNLFRLMDGKMEQVGMSWLKHGFLALAQNACGCGCQNPGSGALLGIGCSDPYCSGLNAQQSNLGPRYQVNASNGVFQYPWNTGAPPVTNGATRRGQVHTADLQEGLNNGALFYVEGQYVTQDDAQAGNAYNNASHRQVFVAAGPQYNISLTGPTFREQPAIMAWEANDASVTTTSVDIPEPSGPAGRVFVAYNVTEGPAGTWNYEYAVQNLNSHESIQAFRVPLNGAAVSSTGFHDVDYHSGDGNGWVNFDGTDWPSSIVTGGATMLQWATQTMAQNVNANALRWGTLYNFRFSTNSPPTAGTIQMVSFRNGLTVSVAAAVPQGGCIGDLDGDGAVGGSDLAILLGQWGGSGSADLDNSGEVDGADLAVLLGQWGDC